MENIVKTVEIPAEEAVFWLDANGRWHNADGKFRHKKIIDYFHASIKRDQKGYHLYQNHENYIEKVYFKYEDTALFVFDAAVREGSDEILLILNTKEELPLNPKTLFVQNENLYMEHAGERIKFLDRVLLKLTDRLRFDQNRYRLELSEKTYDIPVRT